MILTILLHCLDLLVLLRTDCQECYLLGKVKYNSRRPCVRATPLIQRLTMLHPLNEVLSPPFCYELWEAMCSISSLFDGALDAVMNNFIYFERELHCLPPNVKSRIAQRMCKRGLMTDHNAPLVSIYT